MAVSQHADLVLEARGREVVVVAAAVVAEAAAVAAAKVERRPLGVLVVDVEDAPADATELGETTSVFSMACVEGC